MFCYTEREFNTPFLIFTGMSEEIIDVFDLTDIGLLGIVFVSNKEYERIADKRLTNKIQNPYFNNSDFRYFMN